MHLHPSTWPSKLTKIPVAAAVKEALTPLVIKALREGSSEALEGVVAMQRTTVDGSAREQVETKAGTFMLLLKRLNDLDSI